MLSRLFSRTSPWGLLAAGLVVGITASPGIRKGLRAVAVKTTRLALSVTDATKNCGGKIGEGFGEIVSEAKAQQRAQTGMKTEVIQSKVHAAGVTAVGAGMAAVDKVKDASGSLKQKWNDLVAEAKDIKKEQLETAVDTNKEKAERPEITTAEKTEADGESSV